MGIEEIFPCPADWATRGSGTLICVVSFSEARYFYHFKKKKQRLFCYLKMAILLQFAKMSFYIKISYWNE